MLATPPLPEGFEPVLSDSGGFMSLCGPMYVRRREGEPPVLAMRIAEKHLNLRGIAHGGLLVSLADTALGHALNRARGAGKTMSLVTANLSTDFVEPARLGDWVEAHVDIQRVGSRMAFANAYLHVGERRILRASGVFAAVQPLPHPAPPTA